MTTSQPELKSLFLEAIERPEGSERAAYLDGACRGDASLRAQLNELLEAHDRAGGFLASAAETAAGGGVAETRDLSDAAAVATAPPTTAAGASGDANAASGPDPAPGGQAAARPIAEGPGSRVGPYTLLRRLGEGGMGAVFLAQQERPVHRTVERGKGDGNNMTNVPGLVLSIKVPLADGPAAVGPDRLAPTRTGRAGRLSAGPRPPAGTGS